MTYMPARRLIAQHESRQLRTHPPRLWHLIHQESHAMRLLLHAGRHVRVRALTLNPNVRVT